MIAKAPEEIVNAAVDAAFGEALSSISNVLAHGAASGGASGGGGGASTHVFDGHNIRVVEIDGEPWFVGVDVCGAIGIADPSYAYARVNKEEKRMTGRTRLGMAPGRDLVVVNESGLYKLIMRSDKPEARAFQTWITRDVLPAIRKDGGYVLGEEKVTRLDPVSGRPEMTIEELEVKLAAMKAAKVSRLEEELAELRRQLDEERELRIAAEVGVKEAYAKLNRIPQTLRSVTARDLCEENFEGNATMREIFTLMGQPNALRGEDDRKDAGLRIAAAARAAGQLVGDIVAGIKGGDLHRAKTYPIEWAKRWLRENYKAIFGNPEDRSGTPEHTAMLKRRLGISRGRSNLRPSAAWTGGGLDTEWFPYQFLVRELHYAISYFPRRLG